METVICFDSSRLFSLGTVICFYHLFSLENSHHVLIWVFTLPFVFVFVSAIAFAGLCLCTDHLLSLEVMLRLLCLSSNLAWMGGKLLIYKKFYCENSEKKGTNDQIETKSTVLNFKTF